MRNVIAISLFMLFQFNHYQSYGQNRDLDSLRQVLIGHLDSIKVCSCKPGPISYIEDSTGKKVSTRTISLKTSKSLYRFVESNFETLKPILIGFLEFEKYDWPANLLLYHFSKAPSWKFVKYCPDKEDVWRALRKEEDLDFWRKYKG